jgi:hypothetical protein
MARFPVKIESLENRVNNGCESILQPPLKAALEQEQSFPEAQWRIIPAWLT